MYPFIIQFYLALILMRKMAKQIGLIQVSPITQDVQNLSVFYFISENAEVGER